MKKLLLILLTIIPFCLSAQDVSIKDMGKPALFILDEKKATKQELDATLLSDVAETSTLSKAEAVKLYGAEAANFNGAIVLVTKKFATTAYQEKIGLHSDDYESYLTSHGTDDSQFLYVINGTVLPKDGKEAAVLYHLAKDSIEKVVFTQNEPEGSKILARVIITTKK